jgi:hypothetical protein
LPVNFCLKLEIAPSSSSFCFLQADSRSSVSKHLIVTSAFKPVYFILTAAAAGVEQHYSTAERFGDGVFVR